MNFTESNETFNAEFKDVQTLKGDKGDRGYSAYEIAVQNGFEGTEAEWLESLKGEKGDTGAQGIQGEQGLQGEKGDKGDTGDKGDPYELTETDKTEIVNAVLEAMPEGDTITIDEEMSDTSENPVQNKVITAYFNEFVEFIGGELGKIDTAIDGVIAIQNELIGGDTV